MYNAGSKLFGAGILLLIGLVDLHKVQGECVTLHVSGSTHHSDADGIYVLDRNTCNSRRMWIQQSGDHYLYYVLDGYNGWMIGPWSCHWGNFDIGVKSTLEEPDIVKEVWKEYVDIKSAWENNTAIKVQCYDDVMYMNEKCPSEPCQNGATCTMKTSSCSCQRGYYGRFCEIAINANHCKSSPCKYGASCFDLLNDFECHCLPGFSGRLCDIKTDAADSIDCNAWPCHEQCDNVEGVSCVSHKHTVLMIIGLVGAVLVLAVVIICVIRWTFFRRHSMTKDNFPSDSEISHWKDLSYKRLESLDSVTSLNKVQF